MRIVKRLIITSAACLIASGLAAQGIVDKFVPVTQKDLYNPDPADWLMLGGNMEHWNYSPLDQINRENISGLQLVWARQMPTTGGRAGTSPLIHNGIMYVVSPNDVILAVDAVTGSRLWEYRRPLPAIGAEEGQIHHRYSGAKRGLAVYEDKIFTVTSDNAVVALDARTGKVAWETTRGSDGYVANTSGPIIANGILIAGGSCQNAPFGCYVTGHSLADGKELWRNEVIPHPDQLGDETWRGMRFQDRWCTGVWGQIVYDPVQNLVHYGSSGICPASDFQRGVAGKNATLAGTNTRWAVRPDTGQVVWRRQLLPQDNWDQECTFEMMVVDTPMNPNPNAEGMLAANPNVAERRVRSLVGIPCKNPVFWSLEAQTGKFFYARETIHGAQNLYKSIDRVTGVAAMNQDVVYDQPGKKIFYCTSHSGGRDAHVAPAYDPKRNIMIAATGNICTSESARDDRKPTADTTYNVSEQQMQNPNVALMKDGQYPVGQITAVDVATGNTVWQYQQRAYNYSGVLATAGNLVFNGDAARYFFALDAETGKKVWQVRLGSMCCGYPVTYSVDGRQYIAVVAGYGRNSLAPEIDNVTGDNMIYVFALPERQGPVAPTRATAAQSQPAQSQDDIAKQFAGMWRLVSNPQRLADGKAREGSNTVGYAFFDANAGHMCFLSMNPSRPQWKSEATPTPEETLSAIRGFGAYCATIEIHAKEGFMIRHYDINQTPNAVGRETKRWYTFEGTNRMSLRVDAAELNRPVVESTFVWERVAK